MSNDGLSSLSRNAVHNLSALLLPAFLSLVTTPFIVHRLGDERFGLYMLTLSVAGFGGLLDLGLTTAAITFVAQEYARKDVRALSDVLNSLLASRILLGSFAGVIGFFGAVFLCNSLLTVTPRLIPDGVFLIRLASLSVGFSMVVGTLASLPRAARRFDITSRITLVASVILTLTTVAIVGLGRGIREIAIAELAVTVLQLPVYWGVSRSLFPDWQFKLSFQRSWLRKLLGFGSLASLGNLSAVIILHGNRILVGRFLGTPAVTYFAVPWSISARLSQVIYSMTEVIAPLATSLTVTDSADQLERLHRRVTKVVLLLCGTVAIPLFLTAPDLLGFWMGAVFGQRGGNVLRLLAAWVMLQSLAMVAYLVLTGMGRPGAANVPAVVGALVNLAAAMLVGPRYGLVGLAAAVVLGAAVQTALLEWRVGLALSRRSAAATEARQVAIAAVGAAAFGLSLRPLLTGPWPRVAVLTLAGLVSYHGLLWALGAYSRSEREVLMRQIRLAIPGATRTGMQQPTRHDTPKSPPCGS